MNAASPAQLDAPAIDFTGSSIPSSDDGNSTAIFYLFDADNCTLIPYAGVGHGAEEKARMIAANATDDIRLTITPQYFGPSRNDDRFRVTNGSQKGRAKEYSSLTCSFAQGQVLAKLRNPLSWSSTYSLTETGNTQDVPAVSLFDGAPQGVFDEMPVPGGSGYLQIHFATGQANAGVDARIGSILNVVKGIASFDAATPLSFASTELDAAITGLKLLGNLFSLVPGKPTVTIDLSAHQGRRVYLSSSSPGVDDPDVLRLPGGQAIFFVVPERDQAQVNQIIASAAANGHFIQVDSQTGRPLVTADKAGLQPLPPLDPNDLENKRSAWQACSVFIMATSVGIAAP
jgi:hypothetical protein